jgi:HEAT repeat protein
LQARLDIAGLTSALHHTDPDVRKRAVAALRMVDSPQVVPALKTALSREKDPQVREMLMAALEILERPTDIEGMIRTRNVPGLIQLLTSSNSQHVIDAALALGKLQDRSAVEPLVILFHNPSSQPRVRLAAAESLLELKSAPAVVTLLGALRRDSWQVRRNAAAVLGQLQATWAVDPLAQALKDPHPVVRRTAAAALRRIGTADAVNALRAYFATRPTTETAAVAGGESLLPPSAPPSPPPAQPVSAPKQSGEYQAVSQKSVMPVVPPLQSMQRDVKPASPRSTVELPVPPRPVPPPVSLPESEPPAVDERPSWVKKPVMKLISFLKPRDSD